ncbi:MAG: DoxX family protein [Candidatus Dormibacteria bacterium]
MPLLRLLARCSFAAIFVVAGYDAATTPGGRVQLVEEVLPCPNPEMAVRAQGASMLALGTALALGIKPRCAALGLAASLVPTTYVGHRFWNEDDAMRRANQRVHFLKNASLFGGLLAYALTKPAATS